jgi:hypothetical protein
LLSKTHFLCFGWSNAHNLRRENMAADAESPAGAGAAGAAAPLKRWPRLLTLSLYVCQVRGQKGLVVVGTREKERRAG